MKKIVFYHYGHERDVHQFRTNDEIKTIKQQMKDNKAVLDAIIIDNECTIYNKNRNYDESDFFANIVEE